MAEVIKRRVRDPLSAGTHFFGFLAGIPVLVFLLLKAQMTVATVSFAIFGASMLLLYGASTIYHTIKASDRMIATLRRIDHMMIFILIAGTYTPVCLIALKGVWGWVLFGLVWGFALSGIFLKLFWMNAPRWISTAIYVIMGWLVVIAFVPLMKAVSATGIFLLAAGGVTYTLGAVIYALKRPCLPFTWLGFHELFHIFVLGGSAFHIAFMFHL